LSNFNITATLIGEPGIPKAVGYTYYLLINNVTQSTVILNAAVSPQSGNDTSSFVINPGDKIVVKSVLNPGADKPEDPDDIKFEWCADIASL